MSKRGPYKFDDRHHKVRRLCYVSGCHGAVVSGRFCDAHTFKSPGIPKTVDGVVVIRPIHDGEAIIAFALQREGLNLRQIAVSIGVSMEDIAEVLKRPAKGYMVPPELTPAVLNAEVARLRARFAGQIGKPDVDARLRHG